MRRLLIKDLPEALHRRLKERAARNRRSLTREALTILEEGLKEPARRLPLGEIDRLRVRGLQPLSQELLDRARSQGRR